MNCSNTELGFTSKRRGLTAPLKRDSYLQKLLRYPMVNHHETTHRDNVTDNLRKKHHLVSSSRRAGASYETTEQT